MNRRAFVSAALAVAGALLGSSCSGPVAPEPEERYELTGRVEKLDPAAGSLTIAHKAIPGFMDAMTMELAVEPPTSIVAITPGDRIRATLVVSRDRTWIEGIERLESAEAGFEIDDARDPEIGTLVPAFELTDQHGRRFGWERFRGRAVFVSFIYTRCPLPDYCARMTANFVEIARALKKNRPDHNEQWALLSISIDPEHDTPAVLRDYAAAQAPAAGNFERWTFATGSPTEVRDVARFFGLSYENQSGQIVHSLRTVLIAPDGRVASVFRGNTWSTSSAVTAMESAVEDR